MRYQVKTPWWLKNILYSKLTWSIQPEERPAVYITFDDGPHPDITSYALQQLKEYNAKASFFCIGKNVQAHPVIFNNILSAGHAVGNHTHDHLNGWSTATDIYLQNIRQAADKINSNLFRPPYGRIKRSQCHLLREANWKIIMWDVLSGDFDLNITPEKCLANVVKHIEPGSIVVFHDSEKAWKRMSFALPRVLEYCNEKNWMIKALTTG